LLKHHKSLEGALRYLYETLQYKDQQVADRYGFTIEQCHNLRERFGISTYIGKQHKLTSKHLTKEKLTEEYLVNFLSQNEIAKKYNLTVGQVHRLRYKYGIQTVEPWEKHQIDSLTYHEQQIITGKLLGDGCLHIVRQYKKTNASLYLEHSQKQREYMFWCYDQLSRLFTAQPRQQRKYSHKANKYYHSYAVTSIRHPLLTDLYHKWYNSGRKIVVSNIKDLLTPLVLAVWYMDDGGLNTHQRCNATFATCDFTTQENDVLVDVLKSKYGIHCNVCQRNTNRTSLWLSMGNTERLVDIIRPHVISSMLYKIGTLD